MAIHRIGNALVCVGNFVASGAAATGLTVNVDVYEIPLASGSPALIVNSASAVEIARGGYYYRLSLSDVDATALYYFLFYTSGTADFKVVAQGWTVGMSWTEALDALISSRLAPTVAARTLDVSAGGEAGVDWANVGGPTTANNLSGTTVAAVSGAVGSVTGAVGSVTGNVAGNVAGSVASVTAPVTAGTVSDKSGYSLSSAGVQAIWDALSSALTTVGSIGKRLVDYLTGDAYARLGAPAGASVSADIAAVKTDTAAVKAKTDNLPSDPADASDIATSFATVNTKLDTIDDLVDTEVGAIKAKTDNLPASPAAVSDIPTAAAIATAVWGFGTRTLTSLGTIAADVATAVWAAGTRTLTALGSALDDVMDLLDSIKADTTQISTGGVTITSPWNPETSKLTLVRGDDYPAGALGIPPFTSSDWSDLTNAQEVRLTVRRRAGTPRSNDPVLFTMLDNEELRVTGAGEQSITFEPMSAANADADTQEGSTDALIPGANAGKWDVQATLEDGTVKTLVSGLMDVTEDQTRAEDEET